MTTSELEDTSKSRRISCLFLLFLIAMAAYLRVHDAGLFYYNPDEAMIANIAGGVSLGEVLKFSHYEVHPPLFYMLAHYWQLISTDPAFMRSLSLWFGLSLIPIYYGIGRQLGSEIVALSCASLIAYSHGCIIQSYVVRHYIVFLFFISLAFYCYLRWRKDASPRMLDFYGLFSALAALSHFSGIFDIACIAGFETVRRLIAREKLVPWLLVNALACAVALGVYVLWQPIFTPLKSYFAVYAIAPSKLLHSTLAYPLAAARYILPGDNDFLAGAILIGLVIIAVFMPLGMRRERYELLQWVTVCGEMTQEEEKHAICLRSLTWITLLGLALGMMLFATGIYPQAGTRRSLWLLPLLVPQAGWMIGVILERRLKDSERRHQTAALALLALGLLTYNEQHRFSDGSEYVWQRQVWLDFDDYMSKLGPRDLIITEKDDGIMLANLYREMGDDAFTGKVMAKLAPYRRTQILFNPYYPRNYSTDIFLSTLKEAEKNRLLDGADRIVFLRMAWSESPLTDLMLCEALEKRIVTFPDFHEAITRDDIGRARAAILILPKEVLKDILSEDGKGRACLDGKHDMVPGLKHE